ncbi:MAG TPA: nucleolar RNA-binding Nop10p family protein [Candidatus Nanoarchaeia archaeon]|nr:nucleolar RNA-binding Nop10p family protein [Candidatus Nanoarchaeia archaeon]
MKRILWCSNCQKYTMKEVCSCGQKALSKVPPKWSPEDKYAKYRRIVKEPGWKEKGLV